MVRAIAIGLLACAMTVGCANTQRVTSGGYYCSLGTQEPCPQHEAYGDCQPCPRSSMSATPADAHTY
jgi:hypothetical protein